MADPQARASFRQSLADPLGTADLLRVLLGWSGLSVGTWTFFIVLAVYAYDRGGAAAVGVAALTRMVPAGLAAPLAGVIVDRASRRDVLLVSTIGRAVVLAVTAAAVVADAPLAVVLALSALYTVLYTAHVPAQAALLADDRRDAAADRGRRRSWSRPPCWRVETVAVPLGQSVVHEREHANRFFVIADGQFDVTSSQGRFPPRAEGDVFGEIALLRDVPRTATVTARTDSVVLALDRHSFLSAVGSHRYSERAADALAAEREREPAARLG
jgi:Cyclic nucleotide-binding domain